MVAVMLLRLPSPHSHLPRVRVGADRRADALGAMASGTRRAGHLAMEDLLAERDLLCDGTRRHRQAGAAPASG